MKRNKNGFTLAELLVVIAILMILAGVSFVAINRYIRNLHVLEMDNTAKEIFIVAQNHLSQSYASGEYQREYEEHKDDFGTKLTGKPSYLSGTEGSGTGGAGSTSIDGAEAEYRYFRFTGHPGEGASPDVRSGILSVMLPDFSIEGEVVDKGNFIIIYEVHSATVLGVFYSGSTHTYFGSSPVHEFSADEAEENGNTYLKEARDDKEKRKHYKKDSEDSVIGCYITDGKDAIPEESLKPLKLTLDNGSRLMAIIENPNYKAGDTSKILTLVVKGLTSENTQIIKLESTGSTFDTSYKNTNGPDPEAAATAAGNVRTYASITGFYSTDGSKETYKFILDDVTSENGHFYDAFPYLIPGEDVEVYAELSDTSSIASPVKSNVETSNSLFSGYTPDSSGGTAEISSVRHLENLDPKISNVGFTEDSTFVETHATELLPLITDIKVKDAVQTEELIYSGSEKNKTDSSGNTIIIKSFTKDISGSETSDGSTLKVYKYDGTTQLSAKGYYGISNSDLTSYDGQGLSIDKVYSESGAEGNTGIFAEVNVTDSTKSFRLTNLTVKNSIFKASSNSGGLVGHNKGNLTITNCKVEGDTSIVSAGSGHVGGMVGSSEGKLEIKGSGVTGTGFSVSSANAGAAGLVAYSKGALTVDNCIVKGSSFSVKSTSSYAGGIAARCDAAAAVTSAHIIGDNFSIGSSSDAGVPASDTGGILGSAAGAVDITSCSVKGDNIVITGKNTGGMLGNAAGAVTMSSCSSTGAKMKLAGENAGGILGVSGGGINISNTYCSSFVFATANAGGFIGNINAGSGNIIENCYAAGHTTGGEYGTETDINATQVNLASNYNIISAGAAGGFIGRNSVDTTINNSYTTCSVYSSSTSAADGFAGGFVGKGTVLKVNNCYSAGRVAIAEGGTAGGFAGQGTSASGQSYYLKGQGFNASFSASGSGTVANISSTAGAEISAAGSTQDAKPWDTSALSNVYPYKTVAELSGAAGTVNLHYGDWTTVKASDISLSISNAEKLAAIISIDTSSLSAGDKYVSMVIDSQGGGTVTSSHAKAYMQFLVQSGSIQLIPEAQALINITSADGNISDSNNVIFPSFLNYKIKTTSEKTEYHIYLDDITTPGGNFASLFKCFDSELSSDYRFTPGEDIRITAESGFLSWSTLIDDASDYAIADDSESEGQITGVTNSLFAPGSGNTNYKAASGSQESTYYSDIDKKHIVNPGVNSSEYDETALILNFRHLQNLDTYISGVDNGYKKAKLCDDIWWKSDVSDENTAPAGKTPFINAIQSENGNTNDISVYAYGGVEPVTVYNAFMGIINSNLKDVNGNQKKINNVFIHNNKAASASIDAETNADAGLFRYFSFDSESKVHDLHLIYPTVISEHGEAGGLIGKLENTTSGDIIDHVEIKEPVVISKEKNAGGLVANVSNTNNSYKVWIKYTYVYGKHGLVRTLAATYSNKGPYAGGLIGSAVSGGYDIQDSGASVYVYADKASSAGGFIGNLKPKALSTISRCFVGGHINAGSTDYDEDMAVNDGDDPTIVHEGGYNVCGYLASGGFVGYLGTDSGSITFNNCFTTASVSSRSKNGGSEGDNARCIGGFIGQSQHEYQKFEKCYVAGKVFSDSNKTGAFIGERLGGNEGPNAPQYTGCFVLHGVGFNADLKAVGNPAYTPSDVSKLDFVDYDSSKIKQEYTDSVTTVKFNQTVDDYPYITWTGDNSVIGSKVLVFCGDWVKPEKLIPQAPLQLINGNRLTASIEISDKTRSLGALDGYDVTYLKIKGETSGNEFIYRILFKNGVVYKTEIDKWGNWTNVYDDGTVAAEIKNGRLNFYIDDISKKNGCYYLKMLWATAGENITVKVSKSEEGLGLSDVLQASGNSLFEKIVDNHDGSYTAYIANSRNLMNLNNTVSGIYQNNVGNVGIKVSKAVLTDDIYWTFDGVGNYTAHTQPYLIEIPNATIYNHYGSTSTYLTLTDIQSDTLGIFDGKDENGTIHVLYNLHIGKNTDNSPVGLFSSTKRDLIIRNLQIKNPQLYTSVNYAGVLVGYVDYQLTIDNVIIDGNVTVEGAQYAGGVIGYSNSDINISNLIVNGNILISGKDYAGGIIGKYDTRLLKMNNVGITSTLGRVIIDSDKPYGGCGGLIGGIGDREKKDNNIDISNCYASIYVDGKGKGVGGFIGSLYNCSGMIKNSYASGHTYNACYYNSDETSQPGHYNVNMKDGGAVGGFIGFVSGNMSIQNCFASNSLSSYKNVDGQNWSSFYVGGFIGMLGEQNEPPSPIKVKDCYSISYISDSYLSRYTYNTSNSGVFVGYVNGATITDSYCIRRPCNQSTPYYGILSAVAKIDSGQAGVTLLSEASEADIKAPSGYISTTVHHDLLRSNETDRYPYMNWTYANGAGPGIAPVFYGDW